MITTVCKISYGSQTVPPIVPAVQGDTGRAISFEIADFTPPAGATATYFILKPSGEAIYNSATITDNSILCELTAQSLAEAGENRMQVRVLQGENIVTSFEVILMVRTFLGDDAMESGTEMNIFDQAVEQATEQFQENAEQIVEEVIESIPADYTALTEEVDELNERFSAEFDEITTSSKNLFNPLTVADGFYISSTGSEVTDANSHTSDYIPVLGGNPYTLCLTYVSGMYYYLVTYTANKQFKARINAYQVSSTITLDSDVAYVRVSFYNMAVPDNFMLVEGAVAPSEYISHFAIKKGVLPDDVQNASNLIVISPNLFNKDTITTGKYIHSSGSLQNDANSETSDYIEVESGTDYSFSALPSGWFWYIGTYKADKTWNARISAYTESQPIQFDSAVKYIRISIYQHGFPEDYMTIKGSTLPSVYYPYGYIANNALIITESNKVTITKLSSDSLVIKTGKGTHTLTHQVIANKNLDTWRLTQGTVNGKELWHDVDVEGPIKEKDVSDYMSGYHGDEVFTLLSVLIDGVATDIANIDVGEVVECNNITICVTSDVYFDGSTTDKAFVRYKRLVFEGNKLSIYNTYKYIGANAFQIDISTGTGLYPVNSNVVSSYVTNTGNVNVTEETSNRNSELDAVSFFGDDFTINIRVLFGKMNGYYGVVYYLPDQTRYKVYFYQHYTVGSNYLTINNGDELYSGYEIEFI